MSSMVPYMYFMDSKSAPSAPEVLQGACYTCYLNLQEMHRTTDRPM
jgi:hypothetical protein